MDGKMLARLAAILFVAVAITATAIELTRKEEPEVLTVTRDRGDAAPLRAGLRRCRDMGEAATRDPACLKIWAENRDRFLRQSTAPSEPIAPQAPSMVWPTGPASTANPIARESAPASDLAPEMQPEPAQPGAR